MDQSTEVMCYFHYDDQEIFQMLHDLEDVPPVGKQLVFHFDDVFGKKKESRWRVEDVRKRIRVENIILDNGEVKMDWINDGFDIFIRPE